MPIVSPNNVTLSKNGLVSFDHISSHLLKSYLQYLICYILTHWGRVTQICVSKLTIIGSDNALSPGRRQAIIWTNAGILLIEPWGTNVSEISIENRTFSFTKMHLKISSAKWRPFCLGLNVLNACLYDTRTWHNYADILAPTLLADQHWKRWFILPCIFFPFFLLLMI